MIVDKAFVQFKDIEVGEGFIYANSVYIKIPLTTVVKDDRKVKVNVVNLNNGTFGLYNETTNVVRINKIKGFVGA